MGQTLSHGVYLPAEGERNCYSGLASNWNLLDTAIGDIAGKASASHSHGNLTNDGKVGTTANLPLITGTGGVVQAGSFGNAANTFCEGNDSRLSDARTPVAHTHTKSDVTDLFNSANTWTAQNTYTVTGDVPIKITNNKDATNPSASEIKHIRFVDENAKIIGGLGNSLELGGTSKMYLYSRSFSLDGSSNSTHGLLIINNKQTGIREVQSESNFIPSANNSYDLGSSSYQWNNLYAKNYYYNGTAWGLDKANVWSKDNTIAKDTSPALRLKVTNLTTRGTPPSVNITAEIGVRASNDNLISQFATQITTNGNTYVYSRANDGTRDQRVGIYLDVANNTVTYRTASDGVVNLGDPSYKWKTLNGINPGALSLPDKPGGSGTVNVNYFDLSGNVTVKDGSTYNSYTALCDGWIVIGSFASEISIEDDTTNLATTAVPKSNGYAQAYLPVRQGDVVRITINQTNTQYQNFKLIPCQGNV